MSRLQSQATSRSRRAFGLLVGGLALVGAGLSAACGSGMRSASDSHGGALPGDPAAAESAGPVATVDPNAPDPLCGAGWRWDGTHCKQLGPDEKGLGLKVEDMVIGTGRAAAAGDTVRIHYSGMLANGTPFDSSRNREPLQATLGSSGLIPGFDHGIQGMRVGGRRRITVPPELGYGAEGKPPKIPANSTLVFDVELVEIKDVAPPRPTGTGQGAPPPSMPMGGGMGGRM